MGIVFLTEVPLATYRLATLEGDVMRSIGLRVGALCILAAACGGGSSSSNADPVSAGAATVAVSNAFVSALAGISSPTQPGARDGLLLSPGEAQSVRQGLTAIARNAVARARE
jgi:hypothetical protein